MSIYKDINRSPTRRDLLEFGLIFAAGTGLVGAVNRFYLEKPNAALGLWIAGAIVLLLSQVPKLGRLLYIAWMGLGLTIGLVTSPIIMLAVYLVAIVPLGLIFKLIRRDTMRRDLDSRAASYWEDYPKTDDAAQYVRQF